MRGTSGSRLSFSAAANGCDAAGTGPTARVHYEYDATIHAPIPVGVPLRVRGVVTDRFERRGREYVITQIDLVAAADARPLVTYRDTIIVSYRAKESK